MPSILDDGRIITNNNGYFAASRRAYPDKWDFLEAVYEHDDVDLDEPACYTALDGKLVSTYLQDMEGVVRRYACIGEGWLRHCIASDWWEYPGPHWEAQEGPGRGCVEVWELSD